MNKLSAIDLIPIEDEAVRHNHHIQHGFVANQIIQLPLGFNFLGLQILNDLLCNVFFAQDLAYILQFITPVIALWQQNRRCDPG
ncbi:hypothetical protein D3C75_939990 [compost metagenome]